MNEYPTLPARRLTIGILANAVFLGWMRYPRWRELDEALGNLLFFLIELVIALLYLVAFPISLPVYYLVTRRKQRRALVSRKKRWLRAQLSDACWKNPRRKR
jgi:hypothetical protein